MDVFFNAPRAIITDDTPVSFITFSTSSCEYKSPLASTGIFTALTIGFISAQRAGSFGLSFSDLACIDIAYAPAFSNDLQKLTVSSVVSRRRILRLSV